MELGVICPYLSNTYRSKRVESERIHVRITEKVMFHVGKVFGPKGCGQISWEVMKYPLK